MKKVKSFTDLHVNIDKVVVGSVTNGDGKTLAQAEPLPSTMLNYPPTIHVGHPYMDESLDVNADVNRLQVGNNVANINFFADDDDDDALPIADPSRCDRRLHFLVHSMTDIAPGCCLPYGNTIFNTVEDLSYNTFMARVEKRLKFFEYVSETYNNSNTYGSFLELLVIEFGHYPAVLKANLNALKDAVAAQCINVEEISVNEQENLLKMHFMGLLFRRTNDHGDYTYKSSDRCRYCVTFCQDITAFTFNNFRKEVEDGLYFFTYLKNKFHENRSAYIEVLKDGSKHRRYTAIWYQPLPKNQLALLKLESILEIEEELLVKELYDPSSEAEASDHEWLELMDDYNLVVAKNAEETKKSEKLLKKNTKLKSCNLELNEQNIGLSIINSGMTIEMNKLSEELEKTKKELESLKKCKIGLETKIKENENKTLKLEEDITLNNYLRAKEGLDDINFDDSDFNDDDDDDSSKTPSSLK